MELTPYINKRTSR